MNKTSIKNTLNLLNLYKESGVDELISSSPKNRTMEKNDYISKKLKKKLTSKSHMKVQKMPVKKLKLFSLI